MPFEITGPMKFKLSIVPMLIICLFFTCATLKAQVKTNKEKASYAVGIFIGQNIINDGFNDLSHEIIVKGLKDDLKGEATVIPSVAKTDFRLYTVQKGTATDNKLNTSTTSKAQMNTNKEKASYALGILYAQNLLKDGITDLDYDLILKGLKDEVAGKSTVIPSVAETDLNVYFSELRAKAAEVNLIKGQEFLAANKSKDGIVELASGLQYEILVEGDGPKPSFTDQVTTHYHGTLINGTVFDSSVDRGEPASFPVNGVIQGWVEALQLMPVGSKWRLYVPSELAYGDRGTGGSIGPHETLIFEVELISIN